jgi:hypothetical protein
MGASSVGTLLRERRARVVVGRQCQAWPPRPLFFNGVTAPLYTRSRVRSTSPASSRTISASGSKWFKTQKRLAASRHPTINWRVDNELVLDVSETIVAEFRARQGNPVGIGVVRERLYAYTFTFSTKKAPPPYTTGGK